MTKHLTGEAFDVQPQTENAEQIKTAIRALPGITQFLEKQGGLVRWPAQFREWEPAPVKVRGQEPPKKQQEPAPAEVRGHEPPKKQEEPAPAKVPGQEPLKKEDEPLQFDYKAELDPNLRARFNRMVIALKTKGIRYGGIDDVRTVPRAHILSTGFHIHTKPAVPLKELQTLKDGKGVDGNAWYKKEWEQVTTHFGLGKPRAATDTEILENANDNAFALVKREGPGYLSGDKITCAYEGYAPGDPRRKPNVPEVPISNHVTGRAIDLSSVDWNKFGGPWSDGAKKFVAGFGLTRPYSPEADTYCIKESWHFELA